MAAGCDDGRDAGRLFCGKHTWSVGIWEGRQSDRQRVKYLSGRRREALSHGKPHELVFAISRSWSRSRQSLFVLGRRRRLLRDLPLLFVLRCLLLLLGLRMRLVSQIRRDLGVN